MGRLDFIITNETTKQVVNWITPLTLSIAILCLLLKDKHWIERVLRSMGLVSAADIFGKSLQSGERLGLFPVGKNTCCSKKLFTSLLIMQLAFQLREDATKM